MNKSQPREWETCCCISYKKGVTPCLCGCHKESHKETLLSLLSKLPKEKRNCGCPPFESKHDGECDDEDHTEWNTCLSKIEEIINKEIEI